MISGYPGLAGDSDHESDGLSVTRGSELGCQWDHTLRVRLLAAPQPAKLVSGLNGRLGPLRIRAHCGTASGRVGRCGNRGGGRFLSWKPAPISKVRQINLPQYSAGRLPITVAGPAESRLGPVPASI